MFSFKNEDFELKEENKEDVKESVLVRKNIESEFTLSSIENQQRVLEKAKKEVDSQRRLSEGICNNIVRNNKWLEELTDEQKHAAHMFYENDAVAKEAAAKLEEIEDQMAQYEEIEKIVYEKFGFVPTSVDNTVDSGDNETTDEPGEQS